MKNLLMLTFATISSTLFSAQQEPIMDHTTQGNFSLQHRLLIPADGAWHSIRNIEQHNLEETYNTLTKLLPENQIINKTLAVSVLKGIVYEQKNFTLADYFQYMIAMKGIILTVPEEVKWQMFFNARGINHEKDRLYIPQWLWTH